VTAPDHAGQAGHKPDDRTRHSGEGSDTAMRAMQRKRMNAPLQPEREASQPGAPPPNDSQDSERNG
jgi:hypothetical protein